jgi:NPCBM-associated, NEW3 domain of alpha-galactosidase/Alpha galactosidase C-terminal beta sandwich domain
VDQDAIDASRAVNTVTEQIFAKTEKNGDVIVGLFNTSGAPEVISTSASALGMPAGADYLLNGLWAHHSTETTGTISAEVPSHGVALYRVSPLTNPTAAPPAATLELSGLSALSAGQPAAATESFTDNGDLAALRVSLGLQVPSGWQVQATSPTTFAAVDSGQTVTATFKVTAPTPFSLFETDTVSSPTRRPTRRTSTGSSWPATRADPLREPVRTGPASHRPGTAPYPLMIMRIWRRGQPILHDHDFAVITGPRRWPPRPRSQQCHDHDVGRGGWWPGPGRVVAWAGAGGGLGRGGWWPGRGARLVTPGRVVAWAGAGGG